MRPFVKKQYLFDKVKRVLGFTRSMGHFVVNILVANYYLIMQYNVLKGDDMGLLFITKILLILLHAELLQDNLH